MLHNQPTRNSMLAQSIVTNNEEANIKVNDENQFVPQVLKQNDSSVKLPPLGKPLRQPQVKERIALSNITTTFTSFVKQKLVPVKRKSPVILNAVNMADLDVRPSLNEEPSPCLAELPSDSLKQESVKTSYDKDYDEDIHNYLKAIETKYLPTFNFMAFQTDINEEMRVVLVDWLIEVHSEFQLREETLFLAVNIVDRFLAKRKVLRSKFQLLGVAAMFIACKYEEIEPPVLDDFIEISDCAYSREEMILMERLILNSLDFCITTCSIYAFTRSYSAQLHVTDVQKHMIGMIAESSLLCSSSCVYNPSVIAASCAYISSSITPLANVAHLEEISGYAESDLEACIGFLTNQMAAMKIKNSSLALYNKYSRPVFQNVTQFL